MGCASSKQKRCCNCNAPYSPLPRSYSMHVHHPPQTKGDSYHVVALTSTTLGSLKLDSPVLDYDTTHMVQNDFRFSNGTDTDIDDFKFPNGNGNSNFIKIEKKNEELVSETKNMEFSMGLIDAKTWSNMIERKLPRVIPKTPVRTPPGEPETINAWELMEGLEDVSPFRSPSHFRSFSFDVNRDPSLDPLDQSKPRSPKPMWVQMTENESTLESGVSDFDPEVISSFRKSFQELSPDSPFHLSKLDDDEDERQKGIPERGLSLGITEEKKTDDDVMEFKALTCGKDKVVLYFTSLRGVRKTYEDCCNVRMILKGLGVRVDERDVSMHSGFKEELKELLGDRFTGAGLPRVFVGRNYIGGAEVIQKLHEDRQLEKLLVSCEKIGIIGVSDDGRVCEACGDIRFVPCQTCSGSCKIYYEGDKEQDGDMGECAFQRCPDCNENGLIRCLICC